MRGPLVLQRKSGQLIDLSVHSKCKKAALKAALGLENKDYELARNGALALRTLPLQLAVTADRFRAFSSALLARLLVMASQLHLAEDAFALHLFLQRLQRLIDVVVANNDLQRPVSLKVFEGRARYQKGSGLSTFPPGFAGESV
jgi:hypothetical protein